MNDLLPAVLFRGKLVGVEGGHPVFPGLHPQEAVELILPGAGLIPPPGEGAIFDLSLAILQRYNRPRVVRLARRRAAQR